MKPSRLLAVLAIPALTVALVSCSVEGDTSSQEDVFNNDSAPVVEDTEGEVEDKIAEDTDESDNDSVAEASAQGAADAFNEFYTLLSDDTLLEEFQSTVEAEGLQAGLEAEDPEAIEAAQAISGEVYSDLIAKFDTSDLSGEEIDEINLMLAGWNAMHSMMADMIPDANLSADDIELDGETASFDANDAFIFDDDEIVIMEEDAPVTMTYVDGDWLLPHGFILDALEGGQGEGTVEQDFEFGEDFTFEG